MKSFALIGREDSDSLGNTCQDLNGPGKQLMRFHPNNSGIIIKLSTFFRTSKGFSASINVFIANKV
jgi:hypothetical protein